MMKIKRTLVGILVIALLIGTGFAPVTSAQASSKVGKTTAKVKNTTVGANLKVTWTEVSGASGYDVYMSTTKVAGYKKVGTTTKASYTTSKVKKNKTYYFKVKAYTTVNEKNVYGSYSKVVSGKTSKYLLNTVIDNGGQDVYFYWLWDGKTAVKDDNYWAATSKCEKILRERYGDVKKKTIVGALKRYNSVKYSFKGKIICIATPWLELGPGGGDSNPDSE